MCLHCKKRVEDICKTFSNVIDSEASIEKNNVTITFIDQIDVDQIIEKITSQGYKTTK